MKKSILTLILVISTMLPLTMSAQCSMCRRVAEGTEISGDNKVAKKLNSGILYLLAIPYLIGAVGIGFWYKNRNKN